MDRLSSNIQTYYETANDERTCIEKIKGKYGNNFQVTSKTKLRKEYLFGLIKTDAFEIGYYVSLPRSGNTNFEEEKKKILTANPPKSLPQPQLQQIMNEVSELKELVLQNSTATIPQANISHDTITRIERILETNEFTPSYIKKMIEHIKKEFSIDELDNFDKVQDKVVEWIGESIKIYHHKHIARPQIITLVGATGVGKTLTVAKLAANFAYHTAISQPILKVHVISIDGYRIGAFEQLDTLCTWMKVKFSKVENQNDLEKILAFYHDDTDIILIDTTGSSPSDYTTISHMRKLLNIKHTSSEFFLVLSAATKASALREIIQQFETFGCQSVIITKLDETKTVGDLISVLAEKNKSITFISTGQKVPTDFERASVGRLLNHLIDFTINQDRIEELFPLEKESN